jgi:hypothetical protein
MSTTLAALNLPWDILISTLGTAAATLLGVVVGGTIGSRAQTRHWSLTAQTDACVKLLREFTRIYLELARAHREDPRDYLRSTTWTPWNEALAELNLLADANIVAAAHRVDALFWDINLRMTRAEVSEDEWHTFRERVEASRLDFVNAVRRHLGRGEAPLRQLSGRPPDDDPRWQSRSTS